MKKQVNSAFFELIRSGLWGKKAHLLQYGYIDYNHILSLSQEQAVTGIIADGLEYADVTVPKNELFQFIGIALQIEKRNVAMNQFIGLIIRELTEKGIFTILVKGQGVAQCYDKPLLRASGDVDLFFSSDNYSKAVDFLLPFASGNKPEGFYSKHIGLTIDPWYVELHGTLRNCLSSKVDLEIDKVQEDTFKNKNTRVWENGVTKIYLPAPDNDVFFIFTHFVKHYYKERMSIRQICDWCRLLWVYRGEIDYVLLENRLKRAGLMGEWKAFAYLAVNHMGMPVEAMPLYSEEKKWRKKAGRLLSIIIKGGKWSKMQYNFSVGMVFPVNSLRFAPGIILNFNWLKIKERFFRYR